MTRKYFYVFLLVGILALAIVPRLMATNTPNCLYNPEAYRGLDAYQLDRELNHNGLIGSIHGSIPSSQIFVMSVRENDNFFAHREFSLVAEDTESLKTLKQVKRHDRICIIGHFIPNPSPQKHIAVKSITVLESRGVQAAEVNSADSPLPTQSDAYPPYSRQARLPDELRDRTNFIGKVHAIGEAGNILVVEYRDSIVPVFVRSTQATRNLFRGDIIRIAYKIQSYPQQPTHLQLNSEIENPIEVIDAISSLNGQTKTLTGSLVKFPQSPQLKFDVYGIEVDTQGIKRYFTLVNFENLNEFQNIRNKLARIWENNLATVKSGRNVLINPAVKITANGVVNVVSPEQANPQILLDSVAKITYKQNESTF
jgi:hypothetical protein